LEEFEKELTIEKDLTFTGTISSYDPDEHTIISYISTKNPDYVNDTVDPKGLELKKLPNGQPKLPAVFDEHDRYSIVGKCIWIKSDDIGILAKTKFANTVLGRDKEYLYANGFQTDFSVRLRSTEKGREKNQYGGYHFKQYSIPEYSTVSLGMNWEAVTKSLEEIKDASKKLSTPEIKQEFENYIKKIEMEEKVKELEQKNATLTAEIETLKTQIADFTSRIDKLEKPEEIIEEKSLTIDDYNEVVKNIFVN
jgi:cell division protein FtsB